MEPQKINFKEIIDEFLSFKLELNLFKNDRNLSLNSMNSESIR
jgi:hypothetical protein